MIIVECCEKIGHHELQAGPAEEERRLLREELWRQQQDFREVHQKNLTEMKELQKFHSSTFDDGIVPRFGQFAISVQPRHRATRESCSSNALVPWTSLIRVSSTKCVYMCVRRCPTPSPNTKCVNMCVTKCVYTCVTECVYMCVTKCVYMCVTKCVC